MEKRYTGEAIDVTYDAGRCIHVAECIRRMHAVFDTTRRPWVLPDAGEAEGIATTVQTCPSGALHYQRKDGGVSEPIPEQNTIRLVKNGPLYLRGDFTIVNGAGELVVTDTRASLCRCGASAHKPFCDNSHRTVGFEAPATSAAPQTGIEMLEGGRLHVETTMNGPLRVTGNFTVLNGKGEPIYAGTDVELCRCGKSGNKPFCDGTHEVIGFVAE
jgi:CDGSH-type Zn-finger protein/uncharacterized Fe-S cluster protein YjdI